MKCRYLPYTLYNLYIHVQLNMKIQMFLSVFVVQSLARLDSPGSSAHYCNYINQGTKELCFIIEIKVLHETSLKTFIIQHEATS